MGHFASPYQSHRAFARAVGEHGIPALLGTMVTARVPIANDVLPPPPDTEPVDPILRQVLRSSGFGALRRSLRLPEHAPVPEGTTGQIVRIVSVAGGYRVLVRFLHRDAWQPIWAAGSDLVPAPEKGRPDRRGAAQHASQEAPEAPAIAADADGADGVDRTGERRAKH